MLADYEASATIGVADLQRAREFYEGVLGFGEPEEVMDGGLMFRCGSSRFLVYTSEFAGTNRATAMTVQLPMSEFEAEIQGLRDRGVTFQTYEMEGVDWDNGVASFGGVARAVWFEDPDGNILNVAADGREG